MEERMRSSKHSHITVSIYCIQQGVLLFSELYVQLISEFLNLICMILLILARCRLLVTTLKKTSLGAFTAPPLPPGNPATVSVG
jgi:hypothetical protein